MIELNFAFGFREDYTINPNPDDSKKRVWLIAAESFRLYFPLNLQTPHLDRRAAIVYNPIDFRGLAMKNIEEISYIKFELSQIESETETKLTTLEDYLRNKDGLTERLGKLRQRILCCVASNRNISFCFQWRIAIVEAKLERVRRDRAVDIANARKIDRGIDLHQPRYLFRADQQPLEDLGYWYRFY